jgi:hypothetical protein
VNSSKQQTAIGRQPFGVDLEFDRDTQMLICVSQPYCKCLGEENEYECCCAAYLNRKECMDCEAEMILVDIES